MQPTIEQIAAALGAASSIRQAADAQVNIFGDQHYGVWFANIRREADQLYAALDEKNAEMTAALATGAQNG